MYHPLEKEPELLASYGKAIILHNTLEFQLVELIRFKGKMTESNKSLVDNLLENKGLGNKIGLVRESEIIKDPILLGLLGEVNDDRILLAHGVSAEMVDHINANKPSGYTIAKNGKSYLLNKDLLEKMIDRAKKAGSKLFYEFVKDIKGYPQDILERLKK